MPMMENMIYGLLPNIQSILSMNKYSTYYFLTYLKRMSFLLHISKKFEFKPITVFCKWLFVAYNGIDPYIDSHVDTIFTSESCCL